MGGGGATSGGTYVRIDGKRGDLPVKSAKPNSRYDLYVNGEKVQSRWFNYEGKVIWNRDYKHQDGHHNHKFPHDHEWNWINSRPVRDEENLNPEYVRYY